MFLLTLILGLLPGFAWLFFYLQEDPHPEPKRLIALTFFLGVASAIVAFWIEVMASAGFEMYEIEKVSFFALAIFAGIEEIVKFGAAYLAVHRAKAFDEPIDAVIYMVVAALGFATLENLGAISGGHGDTASLVAQAFETTSFRFVGATLLHTLTSGLLGFYWAQSIRNFKDSRPLIFGILLATILHAFFNYLILTHGVFTYAIIFVVILGFFAFYDFEKLRGEKV